MELFASRPVEEVTVMDIAAQADMTPAAVYYHFASKEQILLEAVVSFRDGLLAEVEDASSSVSTGEDLVAFVVHLVDWCSASVVPARVYFVHSTGLNTLVEAVRRETRCSLVDSFRFCAAVAHVEVLLDDVATAETGVVAAALVSLLEISVMSCLTHDSMFVALGSEGFREQVVLLARRIIGPLLCES